MTDTHTATTAARRSGTGAGGDRAVAVARTGRFLMRVRTGCLTAAAASVPGIAVIAGPLSTQSAALVIPFLFLAGACAAGCGAGIRAANVAVRVPANGRPGQCPQRRPAHGGWHGAEHRPLWLPGGSEHG